MVRIRHTLLALAFPIAAAVIAVLVAGWELSRPVPAVVGSAPSELGATAVTFKSASGSLIHGWLSRGWGRGAVLLLPGVRANRLSMVDRAQWLRTAGYSVLLIDFEGTGESPGSAITFGWRERLDVQAAVQFIKSHISHEPIGVIGSSLGGAATILAGPMLGIQGAVLEAVYPAIDKAVDNRMRMRLGAMGEWLSPLLLWQLQPGLGVSPEDLRPIDRIEEVRYPVLIVGGTRDAYTTPDDTRQLFAAAKDPKELWLIEGAAHQDFARAVPDAYRERILAFFARTLRSR
jgi:alpha-beta hydrolase superfamily lysophospholipase